MGIERQKLIDQLYPSPSATLADPYSLYASLREQEPLFRQSGEPGIWHLMRYSDVAVALRDTRFSIHTDQLIGMNSAADEERREQAQPLAHHLSYFLLFQDPLA